MLDKIFGDTLQVERKKREVEEIAEVIKSLTEKQQQQVKGIIIGMKLSESFSTNQKHTA